MSDVILITGRVRAELFRRIGLEDLLTPLDAPRV